MGWGGVGREHRHRAERRDGECVFFSREVRITDQLVYADVQRTFLEEWIEPMERRFVIGGVVGVARFLIAQGGSVDGR
ncbi:hypothetical protein C266_14257 [Pandoraea sp. SD6-2]|nr:hypothetical protein C266_14257 [Pandoraea sp. SD6-2]